MSALVHSELDGGVLELVLDRPAAKNALTLEMYEALTAGLLRAESDESVRVVLIRGAGGCFTAGNDLGEFVRNPPTDDSSPIFDFLRAISGASTPLIAVVDGFAIGIGTTMLLHCDLVYAAADARFGLPFVKLGLVPEAASSVILPRLVGQRRAAELLMLGETFSADRALRDGIVNELFPAERLLQAARQRAAGLAALPAEAVRETKLLLRRVDRDEIRDAMQAEGAVFARRLGSSEFRAAAQAFFDRSGRR